MTTLPTLEGCSLGCEWAVQLGHRMPAGCNVPAYLIMILLLLITVNGCITACSGAVQCVGTAVRVSGAGCCRQVAACAVRPCP